MAMRKILLITLLLLAACSREGLVRQARYPEDELFHGKIELGEKLDDPYTVANMQAALNNVYPTKADRIDITATDLYVRFLPQSDGQLQRLKDLGLYLMDHPMDYRIVREGDYYQDPDVGEEDITWQYAVVPQDFVFPEGIRFELLDECYIAENAPVTRAGLEDVDWELVEREAFRLTGNAWMLEEMCPGTGLLPATKAGNVTKAAVAPEGRITIEDPKFNGGQPFGVAGVKVVCNIFVKIASAYTDRDGYYQMSRTFSGNPRYRLVFQNEKGFNIGFNWIIIPASVSTLGKGGPEGLDYHVTRESDGALFRRSAVNNAAYDYYSRCTKADLDIAPPPGDLRFWIFNGLTSSSTCMLHHGAFLEDSLLERYLGSWLTLIKLFLPDITIGTKEQDYAGIYSAVQHELAHASHYAQVGNTYWTPYIHYVIQSYVTEGGRPYGSGYGQGAGYCEVGEMWGYFLQESLNKDHYGGTMSPFGEMFWFKPDIFTYLYERGMSRGEIFRALKADVTSVDDLQDQLVSLYPDREETIGNIFTFYGK